MCIRDSTVTVDRRGGDNALGSPAQDSGIAPSFWDQPLDTTPRCSLDRLKTPVKGFNAVPIVIDVGRSGHFRDRCGSSPFRSGPELCPVHGQYSSLCTGRTAEKFAVWVLGELQTCASSRRSISIPSWINSAPTYRRAAVSRSRGYVTPSRSVTVGPRSRTTCTRPRCAVTSVGADNSGTCLLYTSPSPRD